MPPAWRSKRTSSHNSPSCLLGKTQEDSQREDIGSFYQNRLWFLGSGIRLRYPWVQLLVNFCFKSGLMRHLVWWRFPGFTSRHEIWSWEVTMYWQPEVAAVIGCYGTLVHALAEYPAPASARTTSFRFHLLTRLPVV